MGVKIEFDGKLLKMLMVERGVTQTDLEDVTGISQATISRYIRGSIKKPNFGIIQEFADYFSVDANKFAKKRDDLGDQLIGEETAPPKVLRFNAGKTKKFDITEDTAITIAENAGKMFDKIREVLANENMNNDVKIDVIKLLIKD